LNSQGNAESINSGFRSEANVIGLRIAHCVEDTVCSSALQKSFDNRRRAPQIPSFVIVAMLGSRLLPHPISSSLPTILQFPANPSGAVHTLRIMTTQLLQEASQIIPNPQLLINVVSKRVRQLGLGHRPMVEVGPRASLTDIALKEIIAGKLSFEEQNASTDGA